MSDGVRLAIFWADDSMMVEEFPSKAAAIDWLATHDPDRRIHTVTITPVDPPEEDDP